MRYVLINRVSYRTFLRLTGILNTTNIGKRPRPWWKEAEEEKRWMKISIRWDREIETGKWSCRRRRSQIVSIDVRQSLESFIDLLSYRTAVEAVHM